MNPARFSRLQVDSVHLEAGVDEGARMLARTAADVEDRASVSVGLVNEVRQQRGLGRVVFLRRVEEVVELG
jgi:hypothetical protein